MTNEIRRYLAIAIQVACESDDLTDDQLDSVVASSVCALALIKKYPRGARAYERVIREVLARLPEVS